MLEVVICIVVFAKRPEDSVTLTSIASIDFSKLGMRVTLRVRDNSLFGYDFTSFRERFAGTLILNHDGFNKSLSEIYNEAISSEIRSDLFIFLDDDSLLTVEYMSNVREFYEAEQLVAIPKICHSGVLISPGKIIFVKGTRVRERDINLGGANKNLVGMMSGTVVKPVVFNKMNIRFNAKLNFYGVDTSFFLDLVKKNIDLFVFDYYLSHDSALRSEVSSSAEMIKRFSSLMQANIILFGDSPLKRVALAAYFPFFILGKVIRLRNLCYVKLFKNYIFFVRE